jgi:hypothetical protein
VEISRFADGKPAPLHLLDGLPNKWVAQRDRQGQVTRLIPGIQAGFVRGGRFYARVQAARAIAH